ncbi:MAG TPA: DNA topoisomerase subunit B [Candidatus Paceibacterota bacterium]
MLKKQKESKISTENNNIAPSYEAKDIYVLEGLEPVRKRPGMYIGTTDVAGLHHLIWEVFDNSMDEAMAGYAKNIRVELLKNNRVSVTDDGRGIPVGVHAQTKKSALETVMTTLHAGGKFGGESYKISGGLHGVGVSVVNALSSYLRAEICRDGYQYVQEYERGKPRGAVKKNGKSDHMGTKIIFQPDEKIFAEIKFDFKYILDHLRQQAFLTKGIRIEVIDVRDEVPLYYSFCFTGGLLSFARYLTPAEKAIVEEPFYTHKSQDDVEIEVVSTYIDDIEVRELSFANNIYTPEGGMHLTGFRSALSRTLNAYAHADGYLKESEENLTGDDVREGLVAIIAVKIRNSELQFEGQTKAKLGNPVARTAVESVVNEALKDYLEKHPADAKHIIERCLLAAKARKAARAAKETVMRKGVLEGLMLPGKLADCSSRTPEECELFIVEGDSAGGSSKMARNRRTQAILPLRGKILNVEKSRLDKMLLNKEIRALVVALGTAIANDFNLTKLRYGKIIVMTDADVDGSHIRTLLLTLFYRHFLPIIEGGHLYIAQPPLFRVQLGKEAQYAYSDNERGQILKNLEKGKEGKSNVNIQRYKGLGEMNADQLWETTMDPVQRKMKVITINDAAGADKLFNILMGGEVEPRKQFIQMYASAVRNLDV